MAIVIIVMIMVDVVGNDDGDHYFKSDANDDGNTAYPSKQQGSSRRRVNTSARPPLQISEQ